MNLLVSDPLDEMDGEVLSYRAFHDREILRAWRERLRVHERGAAREASRPASLRAYVPGLSRPAHPGH